MDADGGRHRAAEGLGEEQERNDGPFGLAPWPKRGLSDVYPELSSATGGSENSVSQNVWAVEEQYLSTSTRRGIVNVVK